MVIFVFAAACSKKVLFNSSQIVPAAVGVVKLTKDKNQNYNILVSVENLAPPNKLQPPKSTYVVWAETEKNGTKNIGQIKSSSGIFSKSLKGSLSATSPFEPRKIYITAEDIANVQYPASQIIITTPTF